MKLGALPAVEYIGMAWPPVGTPRGHTVCVPRKPIGRQWALSRGRRHWINDVNWEGVQVSKNKSKNKAIAGVIVVIFTFQLWNMVIRPVVRAFVTGDEKDYAEAVFSVLLTAAICGVVVVGLMIVMRPGVVRRRAVGRLEAQPGALVLTARGNDELRKALSAGLLLKEPYAQKNLPGFSFAVSANASGIRFWVGTKNPENIAELDWADIDKITTGGVDDDVRILPAISIQVRSSSSDSAALVFALGTERFLGVGFRGRASVEAVAQALEALRLASTDKTLK